MEIRTNFIVNAPAAKVWDVLGNDFGGADKWASGLYHSEGYGEPQLEGATCNNRACDTNFGKIQEVVKTFDAKNYHLEYAVTEGFPGFVKSGTNNWRLTPQGDKTRVDIHFVGELQGVMGFVMKPMMKRQLGSALKQAGADLKAYVETGKPSAKKAKELSKAALKAA